MLNKDDIVKGLKALGVKPGMALEVHSSLGSFGYVSGGPETVIDSLMECVENEGAIVMPSFLMSKPLELTKEDIKNGLTRKIKILDPGKDEPSGMGMIADTFKNRKDVLTGEGIHRVSAWGKDKEMNCSGFQNLISSNGWALLLGVDIYSLSAMHYVEECLPDKIRSIFQAPEELYEIYPKDKWYIETGVPEVEAWYKIQDAAYQNGSIREIFIGKCKCMLFKIDDVVGLYGKRLKEDPLGLYGIS